MTQAHPACRLDAHARSLDEPDLGSWFQEFAPRLRQMLIRFAGDADLAEEIVQETFLRAYRFRHRFDPARPVWPWLSKIAGRLCANEIARRRRLALAPAPDLPLENQDPQEAALGSECAAFAALSARHRRALLFRHLLGFRYDEIAAAEGLSVRGVDSLLLRARRALLRALAAERGESDGSNRDAPPRSERGAGGMHARGPRQLRGPPCRTP